MNLEKELLQVALGVRPCLSRIPSGAEWDRCFVFADRQCIIGILWRGIERLPKEQTPYIDLLMEWLGQAGYIREHNRQADKDCVKITEMFRREGFSTSIMKGQGNCRFYGDLADLRTSGDIDIWVSGGFDRVNAFVQSIAPTNEINELEIQLRGVCETPVEVHYRPFIMRNPWMNRRLQKFFALEAENCFCNGLFTTMRFNLIHQLVHVRLHLFTEGVGMRQLIDYYFLLLNSKEDKREIMQVVDGLGLRSFASAVMWVMSYVFLLPEELLLCETDNVGGRLLLTDVLKGGNFGKADSELKDRKRRCGYELWAILVRNVRYYRFDHWDWICGPLWRIYHRIWRALKCYK